MKSVMVSIVVVLFQFLLSLSFSELINPCGEEWKAVNNSCIHVSNVSVSWQVARNKCTSAGNSKLLTVNSQELNDQVVEILRNTSVNGSANDEFYIGLFITTSTKRFTWSSSAVYRYSNWRYPNITNVTFTSGEKTLCGFYAPDYKWLLEKCGTTRRFICQKGFPIPGPSQSPSYRSSTTTSTPTTRGVSNSSASTPNASSSPNGTSTTLPSDATRAPVPGSTSSTPASTSSSTTSSTQTPRVTSTSGTTTSRHKDNCSNKQCHNGGTCRNGRYGYDCQCLSGFEGKRCEKKSTNVTATMTIGDIMKLVQDIEKRGEEIIKKIKENGNITEPKIVPLYETEELVAQVAVLPTNGSTSLTFPAKSSAGNIILPNSVFDAAKKLDNNSDAVGITSVFLPGLGKTEGKLYSGVISATVDVNGPVKDLAEPVVISLPHGRSFQADQNASCAFIDVSTSTWSTRGCRVHSSNANFTVCHCSHLTSFAVLLDVHGLHDDVPDTHKFALMIVSIVGCCIALVCFVAALIAFYLIVSERRRKKTETVAIHKNLAIAEIVALISFLVAYNAVDSKGLCFAVALLLHYSLMAVFFWMLIEGINLHRGLVQVFVTSSRMKCYNVFGWVTPILFVVPTAAVSGMDYVREDFCWISKQFIWVFAGPVAVIILINFIILCIAIRVMIKRPRYKMNQIEDPNKSNLEHELRIAFKTIVILLPLLGLTWCLGFFATQNTTADIIIQYLFGIINSLQGLYFFFAHCVYDEDVYKTASQQIRNCCCCSPGVIRATSNTSTRIKSYFSRTLSHSGRSGSLSSNSKRISGAYANASYDGPVFEMPSYTPEKNGPKKSIDSKDSTSAIASVIVNGNHTHEIIVSPAEDDTKQEPATPVSMNNKNSAIGFDAYFGAKNSPSEHPGKTRVPLGTGTPNQQFFRRAKSAIVKFSPNHSFPKRANSLSEHLGTRRPLSKQTSSDSSNSGNSNTPILHNGC